MHEIHSYNEAYSNLLSEFNFYIRPGDELQIITSHVNDKWTLIDGELIIRDNRSIWRYRIIGFDGIDNTPERTPVLYKGLQKSRCGNYVLAITDPCYFVILSIHNQQT